MTINKVTDAVLAIDKTTQLYDICIDENGDIKTEDFFDTSILYSLFGERRANENEVLDARYRRGWIGNENKDFENGSKLWLFEQSRITATNLARISDEAKKSMQWLVDDGFAVSINVEEVTVDTKLNKLTLVLDIRRSLDVVERKFFELWNNTGVLSNISDKIPEFLPTNIFGLKLWLDANDISKIGIVSGNLVRQWIDKSGFNNDAAESTSAFQPLTNLNTIGGLNAIFWDIDDDLLTIQSSASLNNLWENGATVFIVSKSNTLGGANFGRIINAGGANGWDIRKRGPGGGTINFIQPFSITEARFDTIDGSFIPGLPFIFALTYDASSTTNRPIFYKNGNVVAFNIITIPDGNYISTTENIIVGNLLAGTRAFDGDFGEIIIYKRILDDNERIQVETYLSKKWIKPFALPPDISGLKLWLDAADASTIIESADLVSEWDDKSNSSFNLIQTTGSAKPKTNSVTINGLNAIDFDGVDDYLFNDTDSALHNLINSDYTLFFVFDYGSISLGTDCIFSWNDKSNNNDNTTYCSDGLAVEFLIKIGSQLQATLPSDFDSLLCMISVRSSFNNELIVKHFNIFIDDTFSVSDVPEIGTDIFAICAEHNSGLSTNFLQGAMGELIIYDRFLSEVETDNVETYLLDKWAF